VSHALTLTDVTKRYRTVTAVDGLSFQVAHQEILALLDEWDQGMTMRMFEVERAGCVLEIYKL
jgi:ABC-type uncharacterized transport system ATPase subunit